MPIQRLLYRSEIALAGSPDAVDRQVAAIVERASAANAAAGITGALLLSSGVFIQALEGGPDAVEATFERICRDLRHRRVRLLEYAVAEERVFGEWAMVRAQPTVDVVRLCPGVDAFQHARLDASSAAAAVRTMRAVLLTEESHRVRHTSREARGTSRP